METDNKNIIIIGAGPAGLMAAGVSASKGATVLVLEKKHRTGLKLRLTGKGRCNLTNNKPLLDFIQQIHPDGRFLHQAFAQFFVPETISFFETRGIKTELERGGRIFPKNNRASEIAEVLKKYALENGADIRLHSPVKKIITRDNKIASVALKN